MGSTLPMWVVLDLCDGLGWVEFFLTHHGGLGQKMSLTRPMHTPKFVKLKVLKLLPLNTPPPQH